MTQTADITPPSIEVKPKQLYRVVLLLSNGTYRELLDYDAAKDIWSVLKLTEIEIQGLTEAISKCDAEWVHATGLDDLTTEGGPQLSITEQRGVQFWISGDPYRQGMWLRVVEIQVKPL